MRVVRGEAQFAEGYGQVITWNRVHSSVWWAGNCSISCDAKLCQAASEAGAARLGWCDKAWDWSGEAGGFGQSYINAALGHVCAFMDDGLSLEFTKEKN